MARKARQVRFQGLDLLDEDGNRWTRFRGGDDALLRATRVFEHGFRDLRELSAAEAAQASQAEDVTPLTFQREGRTIVVLQRES